MKEAYPIILTPEKQGYTVYIPDFTINTEGDSLAEAIEMARDAIGLMGIDMQDDGKVLPTPANPGDLQINPDEIITLVDVDFTEYRQKHEIRSVKKNCTLPGWLCHAAEKQNINFSQVLQDALKRELKIS